LSIRPRILLVDADSALCQAVAEVLDGAGYAVSCQGEAADFQVVVSAVALDDCPVPQVRLTRPVRVASLMAAIDHALTASAEHPVLGKWRFDAVARLLESEADKVRLTDKEAAILGVLLDAEGVVGRDDLLNIVWGYGGDIDTHTLETHIYRLRQKIEDDPAQAVLLLTEPGGYRLNRES